MKKKIFCKINIKNFLKFLKLYYLIDFLRKFRFFHYRYHHPYIKLRYKVGIVRNPIDTFLGKANFMKLVRSIKERVNYSPTGQWEEISNTHQIPIVNYLNENDYESIKKMLSNPLSNDLMYGFDNLANSLRSKFRIETVTENDLAADHFFALAEYLGIVKYRSPESLISPIRESVEISPIIEEIIQKVFKKNILFPNIYPGEKGIITKFGIATLRVPSAIYQAIQTKKYGEKVCEIGAGLGRTAYFANLLGVKKYTIVDIPIPSLVQGYFLINSLPDVKFSFTGSDSINKGIELRVPSDFFNSNEKYDLVLNVDSLTEIGKDDAIRYFKEIKKKAKYFLSINHEYNLFTISELAFEFPEFKLISRSRSWIRPGYIEELYQIM